MKFDMKPKSKPKKTSRESIITKLDKTFSEKVRERDGKCQVCGSSNRIYCHHIFSRRHIGTRWDMGNAVSLCFYCHRGIAHGDPERFRDWLLDKWMSYDSFLRLKAKAYATTKFSSSDLEWIFRELAA